ncbi:glycosyltransferase family 4 protein [Staphylococcus equorum]|uniref:glycosyltransferase family 4 protein n=1 Tax=Staphylococcus equorum TaxID=246432 RepID=UPI0008073746|nr:glycosyltransferase family 4 protein [Staphylococcus equorum]ANR67284.1 glycosyltransferase WbuB [Staphylococcus equorum]MDK9847500.1 glycosyltransferase family 4 protein [Staphylococcus equorum]PTE24801.1 glycosyltransferase WbuB [Staphylococcus equorum]
MNSKNILILCQYFYPEYVSSATLPTQMAEDIASKGMNVDVICGWPYEYSESNKIEKKEVYNGIKIRRLKYAQFNNKSKVGRIVNFFSLFFKFLLNIPRMFKYDHILVYSNPPILPLIPDLMHRIFNRKYSFVVYDIAPDNAIKTGATKPGSIIDKLMKYINKHVYKNAEHVIVLGTEMKNYLLENNISSNSENIHIIPNWYDENSVDQTTIHNENFIELRNSYNKILLYSGNMGQLQDMDTIMKFLYSVKDNSDICTVICGHGKKQNIVSDFITKNSIKNVKVYDFLVGKDYSDILNIADCCIVSLVNEGIGLGVPSKSYGYLAAKKPIIAIMDRNTDIVEQITSYNAGIHVKNNDFNEMKNFIEKNSKANLKDMGENAYKIFKENYTRNMSTNKYYDLLK